MKNLYSILFVVTLFLSISVLGGAFLERFTASSDGENIVLEWKTGAENDVLEYVLLRGADRNNMAEIATVKPKGSNSDYKFTDENAYKSTESFYVYRLKIVDSNLQESYSHIVSVSHYPSSVKRTWGSIKALFR